MTAPEPLGLIAGGGVMPLRVADAASRAGRPVFAALIEGFADPRDFTAWPHEVVRLGAVGALFAALRRNRVRQLVLAGRVKRPSFLSLRLDGEGVRLAAKVGRKAIFGGDDALLRAVVDVLREEGFDPLGAQQVFADLLIEGGCPTRARPDADAMADIRRGISVARQLGQADAGQGCVVQQGLVLAVEAIEGTDAMLARCADLAREGPGGVLVKLVKPSQSKLVDLPVIGPDTIRAAAAAGLRGVAVEARNGHVGTIVLDRDVTISEANAAGLFLLAMDADQVLNQGENA
ncbi:MULTISPECIES: LpxI family protein [Roseomonadaceae]|uniref:UDP-2,3-diacylglucosamine diphosphatase LpxI n=1 Tax=Falsiroseomonas oleicola TaxID=2801474 RepID=A0ABS6HGE6_9PROT|nr:UDP-2,3-diacylglucosamine diphosphatase LpxI [Roseomonas oleicola]MBU8547033.1 UDP-2,3-diacylglucosamine diphosphatase LpxI [Roseomonas oleicola]